MTDPPAPLVVIGDLHVHLELFERLLERIDHEAPDAYIVTLGDYVDNGPQIPELLDCLIELLEARPGRFWPILGNHDLALLRALGWPHADPDPAWYARWASRYWNPGLGTPQAYGASDAVSFARRFPEAHWRFLAALPWYEDDGEHFVCMPVWSPGRSPRNVTRSRPGHCLRNRPSCPRPCATSGWRGCMIRHGSGSW